MSTTCETCGGRGVIDMGDGDAPLAYVPCEVCDAPRYAGVRADFDAMEQADGLMMPFCACGRIHSACDGSRRACRKGGVR